MVFVEVLRLLLVVAGVIGGLQVGDRVGHSSLAPVVGVTLGALVTYVVGGILARWLDRGLRSAMTRLEGMPPAEVFAGSVVGTTGMLLGLAIGFGLVASVHSSVDYPVAAALTWVLCAAGIRLGVAKGKEIVRAAGFGHLLDRPRAPSASAVLVDTSALLERHLVVLGRCGLLPGGVLVPRFVVDEAHALVEGPDPGSSRRARAGLESLESLRAEGITVQVMPDEVPEHADVADKALALARRMQVRLATCSATIEERADERGVPVVNLRRLAAELAPHHPPGEHLVVELVKAGRQARQAVGYLPDGDMVVVNDAAHLVGRRDVPVVVSSARPTSQGLLLFARLDAEAPLLSASG